MADGLLTLVDEVNLKGASLLTREALSLEAEGVGGVQLTYRKMKIWYPCFKLDYPLLPYSLF